LQTKTNTGSSGEQPPVRMPTVTSSGTKFNDPDALEQLHQRSTNAAADHSHNASSAIQVKSEPSYSTMDISAKKSQEHDVRVVEPTQLLPSSSNTISQETENTPVYTQGFYNQQQQHIHFPSPYEISGGNFNPFLGTITGSLSSLRPQDVEMFQDPLNRDIGRDASNSQLPDSDAGIRRFTLYLSSCYHICTLFIRFTLFER